MKLKTETACSGYKTATVAVPHALSVRDDHTSNRRWVLDTSATRKMCNEKGNFVSFTPAGGTEMVGNNDTIPSRKVGTVKLVSVVAENKIFYYSETFGLPLNWLTT